MRFKPFSIPEGVYIRQERISREKPVYTRFHPSPMAVIQGGEKVYAVAGDIVVEQEVWDLTTQLLPDILKTNIDYFRQLHTAAKLGRDILELHS